MEGKSLASLRVPHPISVQILVIMRRQEIPDICTFGAVICDNFEGAGPTSYKYPLGVSGVYGGRH